MSQDEVSDRKIDELVNRVRDLTVAGDLQAGADTYREIIHIDPQHPRAKEALETLKEAENNTDVVETLELYLKDEDAAVGQRVLGVYRSKIFRVNSRKMS